MQYHNITKADMLNGSGIRVVLWVAGCSHACPGCHNPITWDPDGGLPFDDAAKQELFEELAQDYVAGVTLSGGDPLFAGNREAVTALCHEIRQKFPQKTIWVYTGFIWEEICDLPLMADIDVLVDGRFVQELADANLHWRGSGNQRVIDVPRTRASGQVVLYEE